MPSTPTDQLDPRLLEQLPTLPGTAVEFLRLCDDASAGVRDVAEVARHDPVLMARILQVANSPFYAPREPVVDVVRAAAIIGLRSLKMIGVGFAILGDLWSSTDDSPALSGIIGASTMAGSAARSFSVRIGTGRDEEALTSGLLAYLGELALLRAFPDEFSEAWETCEGLPGISDQRQAFGADGPRVGSALMDRWHFPEDLRTGVEARARQIDDRLRPTSSAFDAAVGFGTAIGDMLAAQQEPAIGRIEPWARQWGFTDDALDGYWSEFRVAVRRTSQQLGLALGAELDEVIVAAKDEYAGSQIAALDQLEAAKREIDALRAENERLAGLSLRDPLTGAPNRAAFEQHLKVALAALHRHPTERAVGVALFDLDRFKQVNDRQGHLVGDQLLTSIAAAAMQGLRGDELFARLGGDEFAMVLRPDSPDALFAGTERVRRAMVEAAATVGEGGATVSAGAAMALNVADEPGATHELLVRSADDALYASKRRGRDQTWVSARISHGSLVSGRIDN